MQAISVAREIHTPFPQRGSSLHLRFNDGAVALEISSADKKDVRQVMINTTYVDLTRQEIACLVLLAYHPGVTQTKDNFLNALYADKKKEPDMKVIDVFISKIRKKLDAAGAPGIIETVWGRGYVMRPDGVSAATVVPSGYRWLAARKQEVLGLIKRGAITEKEACRNYNLSLDELALWMRKAGRFGRKGLRTTCVQQYR